jgi:hypothetical protein
MKKTIYITFYLIFLMCIFSCKTLKTLHEMHKSKAQVYTYNFNDKEIKFIPMHHVGKKSFYKSVTEKVIAFKKNGYTIYCEKVHADKEKDSITNDLAKRKVRKIMGLNGTYKENLNRVGVFKKLIQ